MTTSLIQEALSSFLSTVLGDVAPVELMEPAETTLAQANERASSYLTLLTAQGSHLQFAVLLETAWLSQLSRSMLGDEMQIDEPGADDLLRELAAQAYATVRSRLSTEGLSLPEASFEFLAPEYGLPGNRFNGTLKRIPFRMRFNGREMSGFAVMPQKEEAAKPEAAPEPDVLIEPPRPSRPGGTARPSSAPAVKVAPAAFPDLGEEIIGGDGARANFDLLAEVELEITVELGRRKIPLADVLRLTTGSVIELEKLVGEPLEVYANGRLIAEGEAVVIDEQFGIRITRLASLRSRAKALT